MISRRAFRALVAQALDELPEPFRPYLDRVEVVVEDGLTWPRPELGMPVKSRKLWPPPVR